MKTSELYRIHQKLKIPDFPENEEFARWVEELIYVDAYYMGMIDSAINGGKQKITKDEFFALFLSLNDFEGISEDASVFLKCKDYLDSMKDLLESTINEFRS